MKATRAVRSWVLLLPIAAALAVGVFVASRYRSSWYPTPSLTESPDADVDAGVLACMEGYEAINGEGCLALPTGDAKGGGSPPPLLVYLHGMYDSNAPAQEIDRTTRVRKRATARGFTVLALRGRVGQCSSVPEYATWYCWPSNEKTAGGARDFTDRWAVAVRVVQARTNGTRRYVLGFSNGGYFASIIATRGLFPADAIAIAGAGIVRPVKAMATKMPLLLTSGDDDPSQPDMLVLEQALTAEGWPHDTYGRDGGHALTDGDIDTALTFFLRSENEKVPLAPPIVSHAPRPQVPDFGATEGAEIFGEPSSGAFVAAPQAPWRADLSPPTATAAAAPPGAAAATATTAAASSASELTRRAPSLDPATAPGE